MPLAQNIILDRKFQLDWRSLDYPVTNEIPESYKPRSYSWVVRAWLDQMSEGACVGFAYAHELAARPQVVLSVTNERARDIYFDAQRIDEWAGGAYPGASPFYEGTSVLAGAKVVKAIGFYDSYYWGMNAEETARGLGYKGPAVLGVNWYEGMFYPDSEGFLRPNGRLAGGHALLAHAVKIVYNGCRLPWKNRTWRDVDFQKSYIVVHNSWGKSWGNNGRAKISLTDLDRLLTENGDICFPNRTSKITF